MPLTFVLPAPTNTRPTSHILMTQKSEILQPAIPADIQIISYPQRQARPLSLQINCDTSKPVASCIVLNQNLNTTNVYLLPWQQLNQDNLDSQNELNRLELLGKRLSNSCWYYDSMTWQQSEDLLKDCELGTFLVRNSSDPNYLYSLSVQTKNGPTSIRLDVCFLFILHVFHSFDIVISLKMFQQIICILYLLQVKLCEWCLLSRLTAKSSTIHAKVYLHNKVNRILHQFHASARKAQ